jgi:branched-chain amino acid transport system substrate-binding protein
MGFVTTPPMSHVARLKASLKFKLIGSVKMKILSFLVALSTTVVLHFFTPTQAVAAPGVTATEILIGQDIDMSGAVSARMKPLMQAADAYFDQVNKRGGINGRQIKLIRLDSTNKPDKSLENVKQLVEKEGVFAMWSTSGTGNVAATLPYLTEQQVPLISSTSGAETFYAKKHPYLINVKASYSDEIARIGTHLQQIGANKIGVIYIENGFGREAFKSAQSAAAERKITIIAQAGFKEDGSDIELAVQTVAKAKPEALLLLSIAAPAPKVVDAYLKTGVATQIFTLSVVATEVLFNGIGEKAHGIIVTQVVPFPWDISLPIVSEYQALLKTIGVTTYSAAGMEGFMNAKALVEGLRAVGKKPTRTGLIAAFENMREKDIGGMKLRYSTGNHNGSKMVDITMIGKGGKLIR